MLPFDASSLLDGGMSEEDRKKSINHIDFLKITDIKTLKFGSDYINKIEGLLGFYKVDFLDNLALKNNKISYLGKLDIIAKPEININIKDIKKPNNIMEDIDQIEVEDILFDTCDFDKDINFINKFKYNVTFRNCNIKKIVFESAENIKDIELINCTIENVKIINSSFDGKFYINDQKKGNSNVIINYFEIKESKFNNNFKLHNTTVKKVLIDGVDFEKNADFFKATFIKGTKTREGDNDKDIVFYSVNVKGLTIFEECEFHENFSLKYVTFSGLAQFRSAEFFDGLNLDKTNTEKEMNFYDIKLHEPNISIFRKILHTVWKQYDDRTSQETYRILKYNSEQIGNIIDANQYHSLELEKRKDYLRDKLIENISHLCCMIKAKVYSYFSKQEDCKNKYNAGNLKDNLKLTDLVIFIANYGASKFGTSWFTGLRWIIYVGFLTTILMYGWDIEFLLENKPFLLIVVARNMSIIHFDDLKYFPLMFLFNKVALGYLYYQVVTAVRKDTRK